MVENCARVRPRWLAARNHTPPVPLPPPQERDRQARRIARKPLRRPVDRAPASGYLPPLLFHVNARESPPP